MAERVFLAANNGEVGGGEQMLLRTAVAAHELGHDVTVVAPAEPSGVIDAAVAAGLEVAAIAGTSRRSYLRALRRWDRTRDGLLWCHGLIPSLATAGHPRRIVHLHQQPRSRGQWAALAITRRSALRVVTPSDSLARTVRDAYALPNWTDELEAPARPQPGAELRVGYLGRLSTGKGLDVLADAVHRAALATDRGHRLLVAGDDKWIPAADVEVVRRSLAVLGPDVDLLGHVEPAALFARIDLVAFPSRWPESFGLVVAEAMAAGVPFLVSDAGALPEVAGPEHPWVCPADDVEALAAMLVRIGQADPTEIANVTALARARWETEYSPAAGRERVRRLLREVGAR